MPHRLNKDALVHQIDAHGYLHAVIGHRLLGYVQHQAVLCRLQHNVVARILVKRRMRYEGDVCARILMEAQDFIKVHVVDEAAVRQQNIARGRMLDEVQVVIEILEIPRAPLRIFMHRRQVEQAVMTTRQIPVLSGAQVIKHGARLIGQHNPHLAHSGVDHARKCKVNQPIPPGKGNGFNRTPIGEFTNEAPVFVQVDESHYGIHGIFTPFSSD